MQIITNNAPRDIIFGYELSAEEREQFDYLKWDEPDQDNDVHNFFRYKGELYDLEEFLPTYDYLGYDAPDFKGWDGYQSDTFFSGTLIRFTDPMLERIIVGRYYT